MYEQAIAFAPLIEKYLHKLCYVISKVSLHLENIIMYVLKECSYQFVYSINKCFSHVIEIGKYLFESLIIKQCGN